MINKINWFEGYFPGLLKMPFDKGLKEAKSLFAHAKNDEDRGIALFAEALLLRFKFKYQKALLIYRKAIYYFEKSDSDEWMAALHHGIGHLYDAQGKVSEAEPYYMKSYEFYHRNKILKREAMLCVNISQVCYKRSEPKIALQWLNKAYRLFSKLNESHSQAITLNNIASIYNSEGDYKKAARFYKAGISIFSKLKDYDKVAGNYTNIGAVYINLEKYTAAEKNLLAAKKFITEKTEPYIAANADLNLSIVYIKVMPAFAEKYLSAALKICRKINDNSLLSKTLFLMGEYFTKVKDINSAKKYYCQSLNIQKKFGYRKDSVEVSQKLAEIFEMERNFSEALRLYKYAYKVYSEIYNENAFKEISVLKSEIEKQRAENEAEIHRLKSEELKRELESKTTELNLMASYLVKKNDFVSEMMTNVSKFVKEMNIDTPYKSRLSDFLKIVESGSKVNKEVIYFEENLNKINLGFTQKLSKKYPALSPVELKICSLLKINLSTKEIAKLLFISHRTVENHRHRIILKLKLSRGKSLAEFINTI